MNIKTSIDKFGLSKNGISKYFKNTFWLLLEKVARLGLNIFIGIWIARFLGPTDFGVLNYAIALIAIFLPIIHFGLQGVLVKHLFQNPLEKTKILGTSFFLKMALSLLTFFILFLNYDNKELFSAVEGELVIVVAISLLFQPFLVIESWYESVADTRGVCIAKIIFLMISSAIKIYFLVGEKSLFYFGLAYSIEAFLLSLGLVYTYWIKEKDLLKWRFNYQILLQLIKKSWLLVFSSLSAIIYLKIDW